MALSSSTWVMLFVASILRSTLARRAFAAAGRRRGE